MAAAWRTRYTGLLELLPDIRAALQDEISREDCQSRRVVECLNSDHPGELLDLLEYHVNQDERAAGSRGMYKLHREIDPNG